MAAVVVIADDLARVVDAGEYGAISTQWIVERGEGAIRAAAIDEAMRDIASVVVPADDLTRIVVAIHKRTVYGQRIGEGRISAVLIDEAVIAAWNVRIGIECADGLTEVIDITGPSIAEIVVKVLPS